MREDCGRIGSAGFNWVGSCSSERRRILRLISIFSTTLRESISYLHGRTLSIYLPLCFPLVRLILFIHYPCHNSHFSFLLPDRYLLIYSWLLHFLRILFYSSLSSSSSPSSSPSASADSIGCILIFLHYHISTFLFLSPQFSTITISHSYLHHYRH